jgi:signal recognition particle GTPase
MPKNLLKNCIRASFTGKKLHYFLYFCTTLKQNSINMFENLSDRLENSFKLLKGQGKITEINIAETLKEVRRALLDADVNFKIAKQFTETVKIKSIRPKRIDSG